MTAPNLSRWSHLAPTNQLRWLVFCFAALFIINSAVSPLITDRDPWHGHIVIGSTSSANRARALLDHRHSNQDSSGAKSIGDESIVLSLPEREMLSSLSDFSGYLALIPLFAIPLLIPMLLLPVGFGSFSGAALVGLAPPSPPPRSFS